MDYFNTDIVARHDDRTLLMNQMAEFANWCLTLSFISEADKEWYTQMKKSNTCYDC